jgi:hypothetical protein
VQLLLLERHPPPDGTVLGFVAKKLLQLQMIFAPENQAGFGRLKELDQIRIIYIASYHRSRIIGRWIGKHKQMTAAKHTASTIRPQYDLGSLLCQTIRDHKRLSELA